MPQDDAPERNRVQLVPITPIAEWFMILITIVYYSIHGVYKPTNIHFMFRRPHLVPAPNHAKYQVFTPFVHFVLLFGLFLLFLQVFRVDSTLLGIGRGP